MSFTCEEFWTTAETLHQVRIWRREKQTRDRRQCSEHSSKTSSRTLVRWANRQRKTSRMSILAPQIAAWKFLVYVLAKLFDREGTWWLQERSTKQTNSVIRCARITNASTTEDKTNCKSSNFGVSKSKETTICRHKKSTHFERDIWMKHNFECSRKFLFRSSTFRRHYQVDHQPPEPHFPPVRTFDHPKFWNPNSKWQSPNIFGLWWWLT